MNIMDVQFNEIRESLNSGLNNLFHAMKAKNTDSGSVTLKIKVENESLIEEIPDPDTGEIINAITSKIPHFDYSVAIGINLKTQIKGSVDPGQKVEYDKATGEYVLVKVKTNQTEMDI